MKQILFVFMAFLCASILHAQEPYAVLSDDNTVLTFYYDTQKEARGGMDVGPFEWSSPSSWYNQASTITTVVFDSSFSNCTSLTSTSFWFRDCEILTTITGIENLKTDNVTNMGGMFYNCSGLTSLDVSGFKTGNVTDMSYMFYGCSNLTSLDLSGFETDNVTNMGGMFINCFSLTSLNVSGFKTYNVTNMNSMFSWCTSLTSLDVSGFKTYNVTNMGMMFYNCSGLSSLDVSGFKTNNVWNMSGMFSWCSSLTNLDLSAFKTDKVTDMSEMFYNCPNLTTIYAGVGWSTESVTDGGDMFHSCTNLVGGAGTTYDRSHTDYTYAHIDGGEAAPGYFTAKESGDYSLCPDGNHPHMIDLGLPSGTKWACCNVDADTPEAYGGYYAWGETNQWGETTGHKDNYDWSTYAYCDATMEGCSYLGPDISGTNFDVAHVKWGNPWVMPNLEQMTELKNNCTWEWITLNGVNGYKFTGTNGASIFLPAANARIGYGWFVGEQGYYWSSTSHESYQYYAYGLNFEEDCLYWNSYPYRMNGRSVRPVISEAGNMNVEPYAVLSDDNTILTFYYDTQKEARGGMSVGPFKWVWVETDGGAWVPNCSWYQYRDNITTVVFDDSFSKCTSLTSTENWFYHCRNLTSITGIENLNTDNVTDMGYMFNNCRSLTSLDVSGFNTENVTEMWGMFSNCRSLTSLDVSGFNTEKVTGMWSMFESCSSLTSLDVSGFKTDNVTDMGDMFDGCSSLTSLDLSGFNTENVTDMIRMFDGCSSLTSLDVSSFKTDNVTNMGAMFFCCSSLTSLDVSGFNTENVTDMRYMFDGCSGLTSLDVSGFNTENVTDINEMFAGCTNLTTIYAGDGWSTEKVTNGDRMFVVCYNLVGGKGTVYDDNHIDHTYARIDGGVAAPGYFTAKEADTDISQLDNVIYIEQTEALVGSETTLSIKMKNTAQIRGFQFDMYLPEGVTVAQDNKGRLAASLNTSRLEDGDDHTLTVGRQADGSYRFLCGSIYEETFTGNDGEIISLTIDVADDMAEGDYPLVLKSVKLTENDISKKYVTPEVRSTLTIIDFTLGDINGDGAVDVSDYIGIANHILGQTPQGFNEKAADVNQDGSIDVSDYIGVANIILSGSIFGSQQQSRISRHGYME